MTQTKISHGNTTLMLTQEPYPDTVSRRIGDTVSMIDGNVYRAHAVDENDKESDVFWTLLTPDGEVSDWENFVVD